METGGKVIRELRMSKRLTLKQLAEMVDVNYVFLSRMERGLESVSEELIERLIDTLGYNGDKNELIAKFGKVPSDIQKMIIDDPQSVIDLPAYFKSRRKKGGS
jgi:transcriptional regulator with XRE-family HTH domain